MRILEETADVLVENPEIKKRIIQAKENGGTYLDLSELGLISKDLALLEPLIKKQLPELKLLNLHVSTITTESIQDDKIGLNGIGLLGVTKRSISKIKNKTSESIISPQQGENKFIDYKNNKNDFFEQIKHITPQLNEFGSGNKLYESMTTPRNLDYRSSTQLKNNRRVNKPTNINNNNQFKMG